MNQTPLPKLDDEELLHLAIEASNKQRHGDAIEYLKRAIAQSASNFNAHFLLGAEYAQIGLVERALEDFNRALKIEPNLFPARFQLGLLLLCNARVQEALDAWKPLEALDAANPYRHFASGLASLARDEFDACTKSLLRGIELNRSNPALNTDMQRVLDEIKAKTGPGAPPPAAGADQAQPGQLLLSAYTKRMN
jgi:tetratricopeptide (TPR) repeat protein